MSLTYNVILDNPPNETWGSVVEKTDFKQVLLFFRLLDDDLLDEEEKTIAVLNLFFNEVPNDEELFSKLESFISCNKEKTTGKKQKTVFDYNIDHGRLFSAFLQVYGIDLRSAKMHWWTFCELFENLPDDTKLMQVIELRGKKPSKTDSKEYKKQLAEMQRAYSIKKFDDNALERFFERL